MRILRMDLYSNCHPCLMEGLHCDCKFGYHSLYYVHCAHQCSIQLYPENVYDDEIETTEVPV